ncbi:MAG: MFS transporter [Candidatus Aureabacteria bacterium]|nr:MFS transporter [Candidatus Auribacterota bacterium]
MLHYASSDKKVNQSLIVSFWDGIFAASMTGFIQDYFTPFLLTLGASARQIGIFSALSNLCASLVQVKSADTAEKWKSRKKIINIFVFFQATIILIMASAIILHQKSIFFYIVILMFFTSLGAFALPAWGSLMCDLIPDKKRGEYFGWRNKILGLVTVITSFVSGYLIYTAKRMGHLVAGFALIFFLAYVCRMISLFFLTRMHDPSPQEREQKPLSFFNFILQIKKNNFGRFVLFISLMSFSVNLSAPFFSVLMLRDLHFSYMQYTLVMISSALVIILSNRRWGVHADRMGNLRIIRFTSRFIIFVPVLWLVNQNPFYLVGVQIISGFVWAGFNLCAGNFIYDACTRENRIRGIAYYNVTNGFFLCLGSLLGGILSHCLPSLMGTPIFSLLIVSAAARLLTFLIPFRLEEVRPVEEMRSLALIFSMIRLPHFKGDEH